MKFTRIQYVSIMLVPLFVVAPLVVSAKLTQREFERMAPLARVDGRVVQLRCHDKGQYLVAYRTGNGERVNRAAHFRLNGRCERLALNEPVDVWVSERNPDYISLVPPGQAGSLFTSELKGAWLPYLYFAGFLAVVFKFRNRRR